ncbi:hypothetical protein P7H62_14450 [Vagococcus carniphilus]|uniref:hypothetical protein n=1 Tax=Vagococcus carniphilus TaxID=218144 RepID=UPI00288D9F1C|nr:hypothetical protein [Vagococcus carniphilus]MDT2832280.1 hypothetical protein [Vagococcus carniphilus]MDT2840725.1 hypothetical protein [Vagococcus carniphilus]MDT2855663.1 hypothetical protein [Vagococcus carniphilus]
MVEYSFDIGWGVHGFAPFPNQKIKSKSEYWKEFIKNSAKYNKMSEVDVAKYMGDVYEKNIELSR